MNILHGHIDSLTSSGSLTLVHVNVRQTRLSAIVIDRPDTAPYLKLGNSVTVLFKETEVVVGRGTEHFVSLQNKLPGSVESIAKGELLSRLVLATAVGKVVSVITTNALRQLALEPGSAITAMIKTNEMMLSE